MELWPFIFFVIGILPAWIRGPDRFSNRNEFIHASQWFWLNSNKISRKRKSTDDDEETALPSKKKQKKRGE